MLDKLLLARTMSKKVLKKFSNLPNYALFLNGTSLVHFKVIRLEKWQSILIGFIASIVLKLQSVSPVNVVSFQT